MYFYDAFDFCFEPMDVSNTKKSKALPACLKSPEPLLDF